MTGKKVLNQNELIVQHNGLSITALDVVCYKSYKYLSRLGWSVTHLTKVSHKIQLFLVMTF